MAPGKFPGCSGTRNLHDNISDLRAQVAANQKVCVGPFISKCMVLPNIASFTLGSVTTWFTQGTQGHFLQYC